MEDVGHLLTRYIHIYICGRGEGEMEGTDV